MRRVRDYFEARAILEVDTPALSPYAVSDTQIESFEISKSLVSQRPLFLHTSPEFCMKRLLCAGYPDIFSICRVYRDGEYGRQHQPEFTMIEWYRLDLDLRGIIDDTLGLIHSALTTTILKKAPIEHEYRDIFMQVAEVDPLTASVGDLQEAASADADLHRSIGEERDDWLDLILATRIAPTFENHRLTVLRHYPASQAALARLCPDDRRVADRFEVFCGPLELANGYVELIDAEEQRARMQKDKRYRVRRKRHVRPLDTAFLAAMESGLPPCAGVALGFERLHMIHDGTDDVRDVVSFPFQGEA